MIIPHKEIVDVKKKNRISDYRLSVLSGVSAHVIGNFRKNPNYKITAENLLKICKPLGFELSNVNQKNNN